jgi:transposase
MLLQAFYSVRSERQLMERLECDLLFRWFVGLGVDEPMWGVGGSVRNFVCGRAVEHYAAMALIKRSPKITAN